MNALVVGGTGFLGLNLCAELKARGIPCATTRRRSSNTLFARRLGIELCHADLDTGEGLAEACAGRDVVFFCAGHYPRFSVDTEAQTEVAVRRLQSVLDAARAAGVRRLVYYGTVSTIGPAPEGRLVDESCGLATPDPRDTYTIVKLALARALHAAEGIEVVELCPTGCLGPYDHKVGTGYFLLGLLSARLDFWVEGRVNFVDARDVAFAAIAAAERAEPGERILIGGHNLEVRAFVEHVCERFGVPRPRRGLGAEEAWALAEAEEARCLAEGRGRPALSVEMAAAITGGHFVDISRAKARLGLAPRPLDETLDDAARWYRAHGYLPREFTLRRSA